MEVQLAIDAMRCERCAESIERYLRRQSGVETATVEFDRGRGTVAVGSDVDLDAILTGLESMGYNTSIEGPRDDG